MVFFLRFILLLSFLLYLAAFIWGLYASEDEYKQIFIKMLTSAAGLSIIVAFFALWLTLENFLRKTDLNISGRYDVSIFQPNQNGDGYDVSISSFQLNNYKDKAVIIFSVYLRLENNMYIKLVDATKDPIVLKAYDTHSDTFKDTLYYKNEDRAKLIKNINMDTAILCLDTNEGKYEVKKKIKNWSPKKEQILVPIRPEKECEFDIKFIVKEANQLSHLGTHYIKFGQENMNFKGESLYIGDAKTAEDIEKILPESFGSYNKIYVDDYIEGIKKEHPEWVKAEEIYFGNVWASKVHNIRDWFMQKLGLRR